MKRLFGLLGLLAALVVLTGVAWADKSYRVQFNEHVSIGGTQVAAGQYDVVIDQQDVRLRDADSGRTVDLKAEIVTADRKYDHTAIVSSRATGSIEVTEIQLGGAKMRVVFKAATPKT